jgi:hypothetical protein
VPHKNLALYSRELDLDDASIDEFENGDKEVLELPLADKDVVAELSNILTLRTENIATKENLGSLQDICCIAAPVDISVNYIHSHRDKTESNTLAIILHRYYIHFMIFLFLD